jgi:hypothetical protein
MSDGPTPEQQHFAGELSDVYSDVVPIVKETKEGYKTTEFWLVALTGVLINVQPAVPEKWQAILTAALAGLYALARGHAKSGVPEVDGSTVV